MIRLRVELSFRFPIMKINFLKIGLFSSIFLVLTPISAQNRVISKELPGRANPGKSPLQEEVSPAKPKGAFSITWRKPLIFERAGKTIKTLAFDHVTYDEKNDFLPFLYITKQCENGVEPLPTLQVVEAAQLSSDEEASISTKDLPSNFMLTLSEIRYAQKEPFAYFRLNPLRNNPQTGKIEKITSYNLTWTTTGKTIKSNTKISATTFSSSSVLATGKWFKIAVTKDGVYKIDKAQLSSLIGTNISDDPRTIQIFGNGGALLSEINSDFHYDDLNENAIIVRGESDGVFDPQDYILFYGQGPNRIQYESGAIPKSRCRYSFLKHWYSDTTFYFLTIGNQTGKRIQLQSSSSLVPNYTSTGYDAFMRHEVDESNLINSGREYFGESFDNINSLTLSDLAIPNLQNDTVWIKTSFLGNRVDDGSGTTPPGAFSINYPGGSYQITFPTTPIGSAAGADITGSGAINYMYSGGSAPYNITITKLYPDESGWLNYMWVVGRRSPVFYGGALTLRDYRSAGPGRITSFSLSSNLPTILFWDVTNPFNIADQQTSFSSAQYTFVAATDSVRTYFAFDTTQLLSPILYGELASPQPNLHSLNATGTSPLDYIIISHPLFLNDANRLAELHQKEEGLRSIVVTPDEIYNEFSSGVQDITAIRLFLRMLYMRALTAADLPKYVLLMGGGSYNNKVRDPNTNTNFIPTFQTFDSWSYISSKCSDDFYGFLDDNEGFIDSSGNPIGAIDIGIGRLPVKGTGYSLGMVNKIYQYYNRTIPVATCCNGVSANEQDWRNWVCFLSDDANPEHPEEIVFFQQTEGFASLIAANPLYNIDKIYEDAYKVESVPGGRRYPDATTAVNERISQGALIIGFSGHGGELGLTHEELITVQQIQDWSNINNMPLFFTATCEFSRYDDPSRISAGEYVVVNPNGGGIGSFTTTREAFSSDGQALGSTFYPTAITKLQNGKYPALGDIIKTTKFLQPDYLHFTLLGDPALVLSYPKENVQTSLINSHVTVTNVNDTMSALGKYTVQGNITDPSGNLLTGFNGSIYSSVFDKPAILVTLDNSGNGASCIDTFRLQKNTLFKGNSSVINGTFQFSFIMPKDIFYNYGLGKLSYYAQADTMDAAGYYKNVVVGGTSNNPVIDTQGPNVKLFMNSTQFVPGGTTNENPYIYAEVNDSSGVNTTGNGLGHDISAVLDGVTAHSYVLNDYYQSNQNTYQSGKVQYQLNQLANGPHHLNLKVWDILNNSSTTSTDFVVAQSASMALTHVLNYPNPFTTSTKFFVEHNQTCEYLTVEVEIFTITGRIVKTLNETVHTDGFRIDGISWDGRDDFGDKLGRGVYIYKVTVKNVEGLKADKIEKLVILN